MPNFHTCFSASIIMSSIGTLIFPIASKFYGEAFLFFQMQVDKFRKQLITIGRQRKLYGGNGLQSEASINFTEATDYNWNAA